MKLQTNSEEVKECSSRTKIHYLWSKNNCVIGNPVKGTKIELNVDNQLLKSNISSLDNFHFDSRQKNLIIQQTFFWRKVKKASLRFLK